MSTTTELRDKIGAALGYRQDDRGTWWGPCVDCGHRKASVTKLAYTCPSCGPKTLDDLSRRIRGEEKAESSPAEHLTDLGNAKRLVRAYGRKIRHVGEWGAWHSWDGRRWQKDRTGAVQRMAKDTVRLMHREALDLEDRKRAAEVSKWAFRSEAEARLKAMISLARTELDVAVRPEDMDADPWAFNVENGTVDLRTGELRPHEPTDLITKLAPVQYDPEAEPVRWLSFLHEIMDDDVELVDFLQRAVAYSMIGHVQEHVLLFLYGLGANGKTTFLNVLLRLFGDYGQQAEPDLLIRKRGESHPTGVADLKGARLVATSEIDAGRRLAESLVKQLTGGDRIKARYMRQDFFEFEPTHTLFMAANHKPVVKGTDNAIWRRIRLVPFDVTIPPERQDPQLGEKLEEELPGILNWALEGCRKWREEGLDAPEAVRAATADYRADMDDLGGFLDEHCIIDNREDAEGKKLYARYKEWAEEAGVRPVARNVFGRQLQERGFETGKHHQTRRVVYLGLGLTTGSEGTRSYSLVDPIEKTHVETNETVASGGFGGDVDELLETEA